MSKRFPIPAFDYERHQNLEWAAPSLLSPGERDRLEQAARTGDASAYGSYPIAAGDDFYERFRLRGPNRHVRMCLLPQREVKLVGRSHAWFIQEALVVDSLDASCVVLHQWKTPRPMNTRLGPEEGVALPGGPVYVVCSHRYSDYWIVNRTTAGGPLTPDAKGFSVLSTSDDGASDFHHCNLYFSWS
jgi:hypothetical protein